MPSLAIFLTSSSTGNTPSSSISSHLHDISLSHLHLTYLVDPTPFSPGLILYSGLVIPLFSRLDHHFTEMSSFSLPISEMQEEHEDTMPDQWDPRPLFTGVVRTDGFRRIGEDRVVRNTDRETATAFAELAALVRSDDELWVFADGSMRDVPQMPLLPQRGGYAVVYPHQTEKAAWSASSWHLPVYNPGQPEFFGVCEALNTAVELRLGVHGATRWSADLHRPLRVTIFTDCLAVLDRLVAGLSGLLWDECWGVNAEDECSRDYAARRINATMAVPCLVKAIDLFCELEHQLNCTVEFRFIPGHGHWVWPHRTADDMAGAASLHGQSKLDITSNNILPYYRPVGEELLEQCEEIARRHPDLDDEGQRWSWK
ncbi:hypothetical protein B0T26DRAFT_675688 [Lasiosphaeria miniovina]|uniref:Uncharacterized protein n=1 Tax=Lasiosphaeria miniovina TaxID=1954250 RepID=A0AA40DXK5_9PEZI|nr:uncharacterized protein B0T26DRAFT_675688 [Lasiosphaeria miniovina]KAK0717367.1 hypothetical protein B0T26DRAFT_675688 [Lasiosphaeria miniovina]